MYHRQNINNQKPYQTVDFSTFRKKTNDIAASYQNNKITLYPQNDNNILIILAFFQFTSNVLINDDIFDKFNFDQSPKHFQTFTHEKTIKYLLKIIIDKTTSPKVLIQLIDEFPIVSFILESYCRAVCINYIRNHKQTSFIGNQQAIIQDYTLQIRGPLLQILADCLGMYITINILDNQANYGQQKNSKKIIINMNDNFIQAELLDKKVNIINSAHKSYPNSTAKTNYKQTEPYQSTQTTTIGQNSSLLRQSVVTDSGKCQKCKLVKGRCVCSKKVFNSPYHTPKSGTNNERVSNQNSLNLNFNITNQGKCTCNKIFCICRK